MTKRELFRAAMNGERTDRFCHLEQGFLPEAYERFRGEGAPGGGIVPDLFAPSAGDLFTCLNILKCGYIKPETYAVPPFETKTVEETDRYIIYTDGKGVTLKVSKASACTPQYLEFPIAGRADYYKHRDRFTAGRGGLRQSSAITAAVAGYSGDQDYAAPCTHMDGFFAFTREIMGVVNALYCYYDDPELMHMMLDDRVDLYIEAYTPILDAIKLDYAFIWEDMCFKNGPFISPALFREFCMPAYKRIISFLHDYGVKNIVVDSDGDVRLLLPLWLEAGVTSVLPFEVQAGMDIVEIGEAFPGLCIIGGINKYALMGGREAIDAELGRVLPAMARRGRYIASLDHWVPEYISFDSFNYYVEKVQSFRI